MVVNYEGYISWNHHWKLKWHLLDKGRSHVGQGSSYINKNRNIYKIRYEISSRSSKGIFIERFTDHQGKKVFHQEFETCGIHEKLLWWYKVKQIKGFKLFQKKLFIGVSMTQRKNGVCVLIFDFVQVMSYSYIYHEPMIYLNIMIKRNDILVQMDEGMHGSHIQ